MKKLAFLWASILCVVACHQEKKQQPNFVFIFADDLGYGDLGCYGATDIKTPHIDRIAAQGIRFTDFYSASSVCSPSRAALLTGRYPQRWGLHGVYFPQSFSGMPAEEITIAELLQADGYATGCVGKWHLGHMYDHAPLQQGFDSYFGIPYSNDMASVFYMRDNAMEEYTVDQSQMIKRYTEESVEFIDQHKSRPFYLYVAHNMPHVPIYASDDFLGSSNRGLYGDVIQELDWSVGKIIEKLEAEELLENTVIVFSSDNGPWIVMEDHGGSAGELREGKQFTFDGGMRVPTVAMWSGSIPAGQTYSGVVSQMDWMPTFASMADVALPDDRPIDGIDITEVLISGAPREDDAVIFFGLDGEAQAYRDGDYKIKLPWTANQGSPGRHVVPSHDTLLFNMREDPGEQKNLADQEPLIIQEMIQELESAIDSLGPMVDRQVYQTAPDYSHYTHLRDRHGEGTEYWKKTSKWNN
ncbi:MAG: sulfatase [Bacteroidota bacterium]